MKSCRKWGEETISKSLFVFCPFFCPSFCPRIFSEFWHGSRIHMKLCVTAGFSAKNVFARKFGKMDQKWARNRVSWIYWKIWSLIFTEFVLYWKLVLFAVFLHKSHIWEKFCPWEMGENVLSQSDCRIFLINHISRTDQ